MNRDGTGSTAHHVFIVENEAKTESVSFTCEALAGEAATEAKAATELTFENLAYSKCTINGSPGITVATNGCKYRYASSGSLAVTGCNAGKKIEWQVPTTTCVFNIGEQTLSGISYHNIGEEAKNTAEITAEMKLLGLSVTTSGECSSFIKTGQPLIVTYTTGNTLLTGESSSASMVNFWWR